MPCGMNEYNNNLRKISGVDLAGLVMHIYGIDEKEMDHLRKVVKVCAVPVTQGMGVIASFSESVAAITGSMGFESSVSPSTDVEGLYDAVRSGADVIFMADDDRYLAMDMVKGAIGENDRCTALGFAALAGIMTNERDDAAGKIEDLGRHRVLQAGFGRVGKEMAAILADRGVAFDLLEKDEKAIGQFKGFLSERGLDPGRHRVVKDPRDMIEYDVVLDLTNEGGWITGSMVREDMTYLSPGLPLSLTEEAVEMLGDRCFYDELETGTGVMLGEILYQRSGICNI